MTRSRRITSLAGAAAVPLAALALAGCGGSGNATASAPPTQTSKTQTSTVDVADSGLGKILVDAKGRTLYLFEKDSGTKSTCSGACATDWPPLRSDGKPTAGAGAKSSELGTTPRSDGAAQVTYNGHPLYLYQGDQNPGDTNGQGVNAFGALWFALSPAGDQVSGDASTSSGGNGY